MSEGQTGARLRQLLDGATNPGRLRGNGDGEEGAGTEDWRKRHAGPSDLRRRAVRRRCLICLLPEAFTARCRLLQQNRLQMLTQGTELNHPLIFNAAISIGYPVLPSGHSTTLPARPKSLMARGRSKRCDGKSKQFIRSHCNPNYSTPTVKMRGSMREQRAPGQG